MAMRFLSAFFILWATSPSFAQEDFPDATTVEAQSLFAAGQSAYDDARYEDALRYFRLAAEVSPLPELQYNIGLAADRLRRDADALAAFEAFLRGVDEGHPKYNEVQARVRVLRGLDLRVHRVPEEPQDAPSKTGLIVGLSVASVAIIVGVVLAIVLTGGSSDPVEGNFGPTFQALGSR